MKKIVSLSISLIMAGFFTVTAQNNLMVQERLQRPNASFEYSKFEKSKLPAPKKTNFGQDWWEPDTVYVFFNDSETERGVRNIFEYNSQGLLAVSIRQIPENNSWVNSSSCIYTYDLNNNLLTELDRSWRDNSWVNSYLYTYTYDPDNNLLTELEESEGINRYLSSYTYDSNNNALTFSRQIWYNNSWMYILRDTSTYDSDNNLLTELREFMINGVLKNDYLYIYTYDSDNNVLNELRQNWEDDSWVNSDQTARTYDSNNNVLNELHQGWENDSWVNSDQTARIYDSDNNVLNELRQNWENDSWVNSGQIARTYDSDNNLLVELQQNWRNNSWENSIRYLMTYDENGNGTLAECWWWVNDSWQPSSNIIFSYPTLWLYYNNMQSVFVGSGCDRMTASYVKVSDFSTGVEPLATPESNAISVYPNPTTGELRIKNYESGIKDIQIFDLIGNKLPLRMETGRDAVDISHLPPGMYFVQIITDKGVVTKKIVKM
ncbi:MAG: T9SS type A sorting domain-containing protein [Candidatus Azobacteroides sp.]|nr:T9SS type A sorting domain-containing protein [Candidatus Azobacteroides sp.]